LCEFIVSPMLKYVLIVGGFILIFLTLLPPTWYVDVGTLLLGILLLVLGVLELNKERKQSVEKRL
jgi:membrane-bound ClpP family serine protease